MTSDDEELVQTGIEMLINQAVNQDEINSMIEIKDAFDRLCKAREAEPNAKLAPSSYDEKFDNMKTRKAERDQPIPAEAVNDGLVSALKPFAIIGQAISDNAKDKRWLEFPMFFAGTDDDPQKWTLTGKAFNDAAIALVAASNYKPEVMAVNEGLREALKFYSRHEHWMSQSSDDPLRRVLTAMQGTGEQNGWLVAEAALQASANLPSARDIRNAALDEAAKECETIETVDKSEKWALGVAAENIRALKDGGA